eukprot:403373566
MHHNDQPKSKTRRNSQISSPWADQQFISPQNENCKSIDMRKQQQQNINRCVDTFNYHHQNEEINSEQKHLVLNTDCENYISSDEEFPLICNASDDQHSSSQIQNIQFGTQDGITLRQNFNNSLKVHQKNAFHSKKNSLPALFDNLNQQAQQQCYRTLDFDGNFQIDDTSLFNANQSRISQNQQQHSQSFGNDNINEQQKHHQGDSQHLMQSNQSFIKLNQIKQDLLINRDQADPFNRLYNHAKIQQNILSLKREFVYQVEENEIQKCFKPKICKKSEQMINQIYENQPVENILYGDFVRRQKAVEVINENKKRVIQSEAQKAKPNQNSKKMAQNRLKKLVEQVIQTACQQSDGYVNFDQLQMILDKLGIFKSQSELQKMQEKVQKQPSQENQYFHRMTLLEKKYFEELYLIKQLWNTLNPYLFDDINAEVLKEVMIIIMDQYMDRQDKLTQMNQIVKLIKDINSEDGNKNEFRSEIDDNMFRNKNKKVDEYWSIEKLIKIFEGLKDTYTFLQNISKEKQVTTKNEAYKNCTFKPNISTTQDKRTNQKENNNPQDPHQKQPGRPSFIDQTLYGIQEEDEISRSATMSNTNILRDKIQDVNKQQQQQLKDKAINKSQQLYEKSREINQKKLEKQEEKSRLEIQEFSFKPQINTDYVTNNKNEKSIDRLTSRKVSVTTLKHTPTQLRGLDECTFQPKISGEILHKKTQSINIKGYEQMVDRMRRATSNPRQKKFAETLRDTSQTPTNQQATTDQHTSQNNSKQNTSTINQNKQGSRVPSGNTRTSHSIVDRFVDKSREQIEFRKKNMDMPLQYKHQKSDTTPNHTTQTQNNEQSQQHDIYQKDTKLQQEQPTNQTLENQAQQNQNNNEEQPYLLIDVTLAPNLDRLEALIRDSLKEQIKLTQYTQQFENQQQEETYDNNIMEQQQIEQNHDKKKEDKMLLEEETWLNGSELMNSLLYQTN